MKLRNFLAMALVALCTVSCSDDDEVLDEFVKPTENIAAQVAGSYEGGNIMIVGGQPTGVVKGSVEITAQENGKVTVVLPEAGMGKMKLAAITLEDVEVKSVADKEFSLEHAAFEFTVDGTKYVNAKGLKGSVKDGKLTLAYDIKPGGMPFPILFNFTTDQNEILVGQVARSYKGATEMFMGGESSGSFDAEVKIEAQEDGKFTIMLPEAAVMNGKMTLPAVSVKDAEIKAVANAEGEFTVEVAAFTVELEDGKKCVNKKGLKGAIKNGALTLEYDLQVGKMPFAIDFKFASKKK